MASRRLIQGRSFHVEALEPRVLLSGTSTGGGSGVPVPGLIHQWKLDETSGQIAFDSVGGADGTLVNMMGNEWTAGFHDGSLAFDGTDDYITVGQVPSLQLATEMTIAAWVNVDSYFPLRGEAGGIAGWVHDTNWTESGYVLNTRNGGGLSFGLQTDNGSMTYLTPIGYETDTWYHVAGTYDGSAQKLYVNGEQVAEQARTGAIDWDPLSPDGFEIGRYHDDNDNIPFPGKIDDVRVYNRALSAEEIRQITDVTPVGLWDFDDPSNLTVATIGADLTRTGTDAAVAGRRAGDGAARIGVGSHYAVEHGIASNGGGSNVNEFTLLLDVSAPAIKDWIALYQTEAANTEDAEAFVHTSNHTIGVAATGYSSESIVAGEWYRVVIAVDNGDRYDIYLNGEKILDGNVQPIDGRFSLESTLLAFADENGEDNTIDVSRLAIYDWALNDDEAAFLGSIASVELAFATNPYLQNVDVDGIVVMWELTDDVPMSVEYGLDATYGNSVAATSVASGHQGTYIYKAEIAGLTEETDYHFRLVDGAGTPMIEDRQFTTFTTSPIDFSFAMWGDSQTHNRGTWTADPLEPTNSMFDHMVAQGADFGFSVGDLAHDGRVYADTHTYYLDRVAEHLGPSIPWFNAWGNHDVGPDSTIRRFADMPSKDRGGSYNSGYGSFAFEQAGVLFIAIDYFSSDDITNGWLEGVLAAHPDARFTILGVHVPPYSERWSDGDSSLRADLVPLAEQYDIDVIVSGHNHEYERGELNDVYYVITGQGSRLFHGAPIVQEWDHMTVGGAHDLPGSWSVESSPGVLGDPQPIVGGFVNGYTEFLVQGTTLEVRMHAFNADGSYIGVLDNFTVAQRIAGDFDADADVDGDDFLAWQTGFGMPSGATLADGDADGDGDVDGDDFLIWQGNFSSSAGGGAAGTQHARSSPSPSNALLFDLAMRRIGEQRTDPENTLRTRIRPRLSFASVGSTETDAVWSAYQPRKGHQWTNDLRDGEKMTFRKKGVSTAASDEPFLLTTARPMDRGRPTEARALRVTRVQPGTLTAQSPTQSTHQPLSDLAGFQIPDQE